MQPSDETPEMKYIRIMPHCKIAQGLGSPDQQSRERVIGSEGYEATAFLFVRGKQRMNARYGRELTGPALRDDCHSMAQSESQGTALSDQPSCFHLRPSSPIAAAQAAPAGSTPPPAAPDESPPD